MSGTVSLENSDSVAWVTLSHPGKFNAMSRLMWRELRAVFQQVQQSREVTCVVVCGHRLKGSPEGTGHFCAGGDISEYAGFRFNETSLRDFHENDVWGGLQAMLDCDVPILAQIEGNCMGPAWKLPVAATSGLPATPPALVRQLPSSAFPWRRARRRWSCAPWAS